MTIQDIHQAIKLELDKSTVASYDDFLIEEVDYFVNKAYLDEVNSVFKHTRSLQLGFVQNIQNLVDIQGLVKKKEFTLTKSSGIITNEYQVAIKEDSGILYPMSEGVVSFPTLKGRDEVRPVILIDNLSVSKFKATHLNSPWIPTPVMSLVNNSFNLYVDTVDMLNYVMDIAKLELPCVTKPRRLSYYMGSGSNISVNTKNDDSRIPVVTESLQYAIIERATAYLLENIESRRTQTYHNQDNQIANGPQE